MTKLSYGQNFSNTRGGVSYGGQAPNIYFAHNKGDKSGDSLLTPEDKVLVQVAGGDTRLMSYDTVRALHEFLGDLLAEYDAHQVQAKREEEARKEEAYKARLAEWEQTIRNQSINTASAIEALMNGKTVRRLPNVLGDAYGNGWEEYRVDNEGQVMCMTSSNPQMHLSSYGPLAKSQKETLWVVVPFTARPAR